MKRNNLTPHVSRFTLHAICQGVNPCHRTDLLKGLVIEHYLKDHPNLLYELSPRKFEEIVAELLKDMGCEIELTPETRDGGRDILAAFKTPLGELLTIVECKRYNPDNKIGIGSVERFL